MAEPTFSVTPVGGSAVTFYALSTYVSNVRMALAASEGFSEYEYSVDHIPGTIGNVVCNMGETGRVITLYALYMDEYPGVLAHFEDDKIALSGKPCDIVAPSGYTYQRCRLKSAKESSIPKGSKYTSGGITVQAFFTAEFVFEVHGPSVPPTPPTPPPP